MSETRITLLSKTPVTPDTNQYVFTKPDGLEFDPGQAAELAIDIEGWREEGRPFTFTSQPEDDVLEFVIKSYPAHNGMTAKLAQVPEGTEFLFDGPFGAIEDKGPGVFLAAGAGITPFIPILRKRARDRDLEGCRLIFSNKTEADIILRREWESMPGLSPVFIVTDEEGKTVRSGNIDLEFLKGEIDSTDQYFYICGPQGFVNDVRDALKTLGVDSGKIVTEEGW